MRLSNIFCSVLLIIALTACGASPKKSSPVSSEVSGWVVNFDEQRPGEAQGHSRMIISDEFLRIDNGEETDDFLLFNRAMKKIFNIVHDDETVLVIDAGEEPAMVGTERATIRAESEPSNVVVDRLGKHKSTYHKLFIGDKTCLSLIAVEGLLPEALKAMNEYRRALSFELAKGLQQQNNNDVCYRGLNIDEADFRQRFGFPIREWNDDGYQRFLTNYRVGVLIPGRLFEIPSSYRVLQFSQ